MKLASLFLRSLRKTKLRRQIRRRRQQGLGPAPEQAGDVTATPTPTGEEGLPEWEPLTPELVEDEAIRGDFVIRWAVVGLALLLGVSEISETRTLLHLKSGQYLIGHGLLPGAKDVLSYSRHQRPKMGQTCHGCSTWRWPRFIR